MWQSSSARRELSWKVPYMTSYCQIPLQGAQHKWWRIKVLSGLQVHLCTSIFALLTSNFGKDKDFSLLKVVGWKVRWTKYVKCYFVSLQGCSIWSFISGFPLEMLIGTSVSNRLDLGRLISHHWQPCQSQWLQKSRAPGPDSRKNLASLEWIQAYS